MHGRSGRRPASDPRRAGRPRRSRPARAGDGEGTYLVETVGKATTNAADQALAWSWDGDGKLNGDTVALPREWQARVVRRYR